jgi:hypothetical protein
MMDPYLNIQFGLDKDVLGYAVHVVELCRRHTFIKPYCNIKQHRNVYPSRAKPQSSMHDDESNTILG